MGVFHWLWPSPLQQVSTTVLPVILRMQCFRALQYHPHDIRFSVSQRLTGHQMPARLYISHGHHEATVRTSWGARTVIVGIVRASCDFIGGQNISKSHGDRTATVRKSCGLRAAPVRCCLRWIDRLRCLRRIVGI